MQQRLTKATQQPQQPATQPTSEIIQNQVFLTYGNLRFKGSSHTVIMQNTLVFLMLNVSKSGSVRAKIILNAKDFCILILAHNII